MEKIKNLAFSLIELMIALITIATITAAFSPVIMKNIKISNLVASGGGQFTMNCSTKVNPDCLLCRGDKCYNCKKDCLNDDAHNEYLDVYACECKDCEIANCNKCNFDMKENKPYCMECNQGYYSSPETGLCDNCNLFDANCTECDDTGCIKCQKGYYLENGVCKQCEEGFYCADGKERKPCDITKCQTYPVGASNCQCTTCEEGYSWNGNECAQNEGEGAQNEGGGGSCPNRTCVSGGTHQGGCKSCSGYYDCSECCDGYDRVYGTIKFEGSVPGYGTGWYQVQAYYCEQKVCPTTSCSDKTCGGLHSTGCNLCGSGQNCAYCCDGYHLTTANVVDEYGNTTETFQTCTANPECCQFPNCKSCSTKNRCSQCEQGYYIDIYNGSGCTPCKAGYYGIGTKVVCYECPAGTYSNAASGSCTTCPAGTYSGAGAASCTNCPTISQCSTYSNTSCACTACANGYYANSAGQCISCLVFGGGTTGLVPCVQCNAGGCTKCSDGWANHTCSFQMKNGVVMCRSGCS